MDRSIIKRKTDRYLEYIGTPLTNSTDNLKSFYLSERERYIVRYLKYIGTPFVSSADHLKSIYLSDRER